jgi:hypothetical protein
MTARRTWLGISPRRCLKDSDAPHLLTTGAPVARGRATWVVKKILGTGAVECCVAEVGLSPKKNSACRPRGRGHSGLDTAWQVQ